MQHQQNPEANLEAYLILNAFYINYPLSYRIHFSKHKSKTCNQGQQNTSHATLLHSINT